MVEAKQKIFPPIKWAQRKHCVFVTIAVQDLDDHKLDMTEQGELTFSATKGPDEFYFKIDSWYAPIDVKESKWNTKGRFIVVYLSKVDKEKSHWPRLRFIPGKMKEITTDFDLFEDSDEEDLHKPEDVSHYWNENTHRAFTGGQNGGIDVEQMSKLPHMKHAFRTVNIGGLGGAPPEEGSEEFNSMSD